MLKSFDKIYILNLHGNSTKGETAPDGSRDVNVFDIRQGVTINLFVKTNTNKNKQASLFYKDLFGLRELKYEYLFSENMKSTGWQNIESFNSDFTFLPLNLELESIYKKGFSTNLFFGFSSSGVQTEFDEIAVQENLRASEKVRDDILTLSEEEFLKKYSLKSTQLKKINGAKKDLEFNQSDIYQYYYRPFETKSIIYTGQSNGLMGRPRKNLVKHIKSDNNFSLILKRARLLGKNASFSHCFISNKIIDKNFLSDQSYSFPLYLSPEESTQHTLDGNPERTPNLDKKIIQEIAKKLGLTFIPEKEETEGTFAPIDLLDYIYAVLHSPSYREKYKEFLKIDFPRVPYPENPELFWQLVELGGELRQIHLLEHTVVEDSITTYPVGGSNVISNRLTKTDPGFIPDDDKTTGKVWINEEQYFGNVPKKAWEFYIGGYQPAEKWLKDRRDRKLSIDEICHYQKIIVALMETDRLMKEIDEIFSV